MLNWVKASVVVMGVLLEACGEVPVAKTDASNGSGSDGSGSGGPCTTNDQCSAPTPICDPGNTCVECLQSDQCPATAPTCDTATHKCRECAIDSECASNVCDAAAGMCVDESKVLYVSPTGPDSGTCPKATPCSIAQASAVADQTRNNIKLAAGNYSTHLILTNKTLVFFGVGATIAAQGNQSVFEVNDNARLRINDVSLTSTSNGVILCEGAAGASHTLELFRATVAGTGTTLFANPCTLTVDQSVLRTTGTSSNPLVFLGATLAKFNRTRFVGNGVPMLATSGATVQITNSVFKSMGSAANHGVFQGAAFDVSFSTIVDSVVECGSSGATSMTLSSSILYNSAPGAPADTLVNQNACTSVKNSVIFPNSQPVGTANVALQPALKNVAADDYHLLATSPAIDRGDPNSTNAIDFDGVSRPQGAQRDSGAFEFKP